MKARLLAAVLILLGIAPTHTVAAETDRYSTHTYVGTVLSAEGNQPHAFPSGARVIVTVTLDREATDLEALPMFGAYLEGLHSITIELPDSGFRTRHGIGVLETANNQEDDLSIWDSFIVHANSLDAGSGYIDGYPVNTARFDLLQILPLGGTPTMLDSDAVPTQPLTGYNIARFQVWTILGYTGVRVDVAPLQPTVEELVSDADARLHELVAAGLLDKGFATSFMAKAQALLHASDQGNAACGPLAGLRNQVGHLPHRILGQIQVRDELQAIVAELGNAVDGCG